MPFARPTLPELISRIEADYASRLGLPGILRRGVLKGLARAEAGLAHGLHGHLAWNVDQLFVDAADAAELARWASIYGLSRKAATNAAGNVTFTGTTGTNVPAGTLIRRTDGVEWTTDVLGTLAAGTLTVAVTAVQAGEDGNELAAAVLTLASPIGGIDSAVTVAAGGLINGSDDETDAELRARLLELIRTPPMGGADQDYVQWAKEVTDVTRAWAFGALLGLGTVSVYFTTDDVTGGPLPIAAKVTEVQAYIDARRPVTAQVTVVAPTSKDLDPNITLLTASSATIQAAISKSITDLLRREGSPGGTLLLSHLREAISTAAGEVDHILVSPVANVTHLTGEIPVLGTITWS